MSLTLESLVCARPSARFGSTKMPGVPLTLWGSQFGGMDGPEANTSQENMLCAFHTLTV